MNVNTPAQPSSGTMDVDEFMAFLETRPDNERWDLIEGVAVMMAPPSYAHQRITRNFCELLNSAFSSRASICSPIFLQASAILGFEISSPSRT